MYIKTYTYLTRDIFFHYTNIYTKNTSLIFLKFVFEV